ncbi:MAG: NADAR family protein [Streptococcus parasanguinis]|nr:NADAR family protein [Streptococcus parasanguinis]
MGYTVGQHSTVKQSRKEIELAAAKLLEDKQAEDKASILSSDTVLVPQIKEEIRQIVSPMDAALEGRNRQNPLRPDWEEVKDKVMLQVLRMKFSQNPEIAKGLVATGDAILIEHTRNDDYWADGGDGSGKNKLGLLLMQVREELKNSNL